jgi:hypothetical protein
MPTVYEGQKQGATFTTYFDRYLSEIKRVTARQYFTFSSLKKKRKVNEGRATSLFRR